MLLTIAICTWNRSVLLRQALAQMTSLVIPPGVDLEVIVVNNNSTDDTDTVIDTFSGQLPIRRLFEPKPGLSNARNTAVSHARGAYVLWTDDDVLVDPNWVSGYADAFRAFPRGVVYGGPILPRLRKSASHLADGGLAGGCQRLRHTRPGRGAPAFRWESHDAVRCELCHSDARAEDHQL